MSAIELVEMLLEGNPQATVRLHVRAHADDSFVRGVTSEDVYVRDEGDEVVLEGE